MSDFTLNAKNALSLAYKSANMLGSASVGSEHILMGLIREEQGVAAHVLKDAGVTEFSTLSLIDKFVSRGGGTALRDKDNYTPSARRILSQSSEEAKRFGSPLIGTEHILISLLKCPDCVALRILNTLSVNIQRLYADIVRAVGEDIPELKKHLAESEPNESATPTLDQCSRDLTRLAAQGRLDPVIGRKDETNRIIRILSRRSKNNPCLVGEPGVGKTAIVEGIAMLIAGGLAPAAIRFKRIVSLDLGSMVAGTKYRGEFEERIKKVISEVSSSKNIILFIDELHTIIGAGSAEGTLDAANILKPALSRGEIQIIGATTLDEYRKYIEKDSALERRFQSVYVDEPSIEESIEILRGLRPGFEAFHGVSIPDSSIESSVRLSARYINDRRLPDKAIDILDEACASLRLRGDKANDDAARLEERLTDFGKKKEQLIKDEDFEGASLISKKEKSLRKKIEKLKSFDATAPAERPVVSEDEICLVVSNWTRIPLSRLNEEEASRIKNLEKILHERIISQDEAVSAVSRAIRRGRAGIKSPNRPMGSFLFLGPTGVGKTELSKALALAVFGSEDSLIRIDMSEYMEKHSVSRLIGSPPGYVGFDEGGQLSLSVRNNPYSVVLFDEIEKAHPDVFNILLQILDDGFVTDSQGRKADFRNTLIIMTSNAGAESIVAPKVMGFAGTADPDYDYELMKSRVMDEVKRIFRPEFLNRLDDIIVFRPLGTEDIGSIVDIMIRELGERLSERSISISLTDEARNLLIRKGYDPKYGARPLRRVIQDLLEDRIADMLIAGEIGEGAHLLADTVGDESIVIKKKNKKKKGEVKV